MNETEMRNLVLHAADQCAVALARARGQTYPDLQIIVATAYSEAILRMVATCLPTENDVEKVPA